MGKGDGTAFGRGRGFYCKDMRVYIDDDDWARPPKELSRIARKILFGVCAVYIAGIYFKQKAKKPTQQASQCGSCVGQ